MVWYDILIVFLSDKPEMNHLLTVDGKSLVSYLTDIFEKLNMLNKQLQGSNRTHVDTKIKIFGFDTFIKVCQENIYHKLFDQFHWLKKCEVPDNAVLVVVDNLKIIASDLKERFSDLKQIELPTWVMQPMLVNIFDGSMQYQEELSEMQNDDLHQKLEGQIRNLTLLNPDK
ncbi:unnamed protein product [Lepeophtheirus salmonis]|uniref:(salmon louse) hypothetical protein n=1 Tax=Lepeophtheirus salmonis TaxID=72036 RepID=A0A7R8H7Q4_LEPSM|nr:unnamed protein product [Lepeophtheirus salmonis]CAF2923280.1 unnamed protein product [Lepeophtheirus salmonis]